MSTHRRITVEAMVPAPVEEVWARSLDHGLHVKWDIRFDEVQAQQWALAVPALAARALPEVVDAGEAAVGATIARPRRGQAAQDRRHVPHCARIECLRVTTCSPKQPGYGFVLRQARADLLLERRKIERVRQD